MIETTNEREVILEEIVYLSDKYAEMLTTIKETQDNDLAMELSDFVSYAIERKHGKEMVLDKRMVIHYEHSKLKDTQGTVLVTITRLEGEK